MYNARHCTLLGNTIAYYDVIQVNGSAGKKHENPLRTTRAGELEAAAGRTMGKVGIRME